MNLKKRIIAGVGLGAVAGIVDVIPMILQNLTWDANLSAFTLWEVSGFLIATSTLRINRFLEGMLYPFLVLLPSAFIIGWKEPISLVPIALMTIILGLVLGYLIDRVLKEKTE